MTDRELLELMVNEMKEMKNEMKAMKSEEKYGRTWPI